MYIWGMDVMIGPLLDQEEWQRKQELLEYLEPYMCFNKETIQWELREDLPDEVLPLRRELEALQEKENRLYAKLEKDGPFRKRKQRGPGRYKRR